MLNRGWTALLMLAALFASLGHAAPAPAPGPADVVTEMVIKMKALRSSVVLVDYVHWPTAFAEAAPDELEELKIDSPAAMRDYYSRLLGNPEQYTRDEITRKLKSAPPEQRMIFEGMLKGMIEQVKRASEQMREFYGKVEFNVGKAVIQGDDASVDLTTKLDGEPTTASVKLIKREGRWMLPSIDFAGLDEAAEDEPGAPAGA